MLSTLEFLVVYRVVKCYVGSKLYKYYKLSGWHLFIDYTVTDIYLYVFIQIVVYLYAWLVETGECLVTEFSYFILIITISPLIS